MTKLEKNETILNEFELSEEHEGAKSEKIDESAENDEKSAENSEKTEEIEEKTEISAIDDDEATRLLSHPMFSRFARGRQGSFEEILADFREMLSVSSSGTAGEVLAKMTPSASHMTTDVALTERQRAIARAAGMTYLEYYTILNK